MRNFRERSSTVTGVGRRAAGVQMMGSRYVELFPSSRAEATQTATGGY